MTHGDAVLIISNPYDTDLFVDVDSVFACINEAYRQNNKKLPTVVSIYE